MPHFLIEASYSAEGLRGLAKGLGTGGRCEDHSFLSGWQTDIHVLRARRGRCVHSV